MMCPYCGEEANDDITVRMPVAIEEVIDENGHGFSYVYDPTSDIRIALTWKACSAHAAAFLESARAMVDTQADPDWYYRLTEN